MSKEKTRRLSAYLSPRGVVELQSRDKPGALRELIERTIDGLSLRIDAEKMLEAVWQREETLSTRLLPGIAIPHARLDGMGETTVILLGLSRPGITWDDAAGEEDVRLIILIIGGGKNHLEVLANIATRLSNEKLYRQLLEVRDVRHLYALMTSPYPRGEDPEPILRHQSMTCFKHAIELAREIGASRLILHVDAFGELSFIDDFKLAGLDLVVVGRDSSRYRPCRQKHLFLTLPFRDMNRSSQIDVAFLFLVSQGIVKRDERAVSVCGLADSGLLDTVMTTNLQQEYRQLFTEHGEAQMPADVEPQVLSRILQVVSNLAREGREGKPVGTMLVIGDYEAVLRHCRQMVINPFHGYAEADRNILDPGLEETIKEFSRIDGAFVLRGDGVVMSAGTYLRTDAEISQLTPGLGARHAAAAMISRQTGALSIVLSESTRKISLFHDGERSLVI